MSLRLHTNNCKNFDTEAALLLFVMALRIGADGTASSRLASVRLLNYHWK
jgi:hypothetical protein